jgi:hypothetical protein
MPVEASQKRANQPMLFAQEVLAPGPQPEALWKYQTLIVPRQSGGFTILKLLKRARFWMR